MSLLKKRRVLSRGDMKLKILVALFFLNISLVYTQADITLGKDAYLSGETLYAEVSLIEEPVRRLDVDNIFLELDGQESSIAPILVELGKSHYFVYFDLDNVGRGNYDIGVRLLYTVNGVLTEIPIKRAFEIVDGSGISIRPALVRVDERLQVLPSFYKVTLENKNEVDVPVKIEGSEFITPSRENINLKGKESRVLYLYPASNLLEVDRTNISLSYNNSKYTLPIFIIHKQVEAYGSVPENVTNETIVGKNESGNTTTAVSFLDIAEINKNLKENRFFTAKLRFANLLDYKLAQVNFTVTGSIRDILRLNQSRFYNLRAGSINELVVFINEDRNATDEFYSGNITLSAETYSTSIPVYLSFTDLNGFMEKSTQPVTDVLLDQLEEAVEKSPETESVKEPATEEGTEESLEFAEPESETEEEIAESSLALKIVLVIFFLVIAILVIFIFRYKK